MFDWLKTWWLRRQYNSRRAIFRFWDGSKWRNVDPMTVHRALDTHPEFNWQRTPKAIENGDHDAISLTLRTMREVFGVRAFDAATGKGLTEAETLNLLVEFATYLGRLKKNGNRLRTSPPATEPPPSPTTNETATSAESESGSTATEPKPDTLAESSLESSQH